MIRDSPAWVGIEFLRLAFKLGLESFEKCVEEGRADAEGAERDPYLPALLFGHQALTSGKIDLPNPIPGQYEGYLR